MTRTIRQPEVRRGRAAALWALAVFALSQCALGMWAWRQHPDVCDPTWEYRLARLRARMAEAPGRPLALMIGSSRPANGFSPSALGEWAPPGQPAPVVFNMATLGGGPVRELLTLRRLLARGIRPEWLVIDVWPAFWANTGRYAEEEPIMTSGMCLSDVRVLSRTYKRGWESLGRVVGGALTPVVHYRRELLYKYMPFLTSARAEFDIRAAQFHWATLDDWGWLPVAWGRVGPEEFARQMKAAYEDTRPVLEKLTLTPHVDWAMRQMLETCRRENIKTVLLLMPESTALRSWYPPAAKDLFEGYLDELHQNYGVPVIDARTWISDEEFVDFCHLLPVGARAFSARFAREVLRPWVAGEPLPANLLLHGPASASPDQGPAVTGH